MKKLQMFLVGLAAVTALSGGTAVVKASGNAPARPNWISAEGVVDYDKMPDTAQIPYECWNGKKTVLSGKQMKDKAKDAMPGSPEHERGMAKSRELAKIPGVVTRDAKGGEVINIDDSNPDVQKIMKKYEAMEVPQCQ